MTAGASRIHPSAAVTSLFFDAPVGSSRMLSQSWIIRHARRTYGAHEQTFLSHHWCLQSTKSLLFKVGSRPNLLDKPCRSLSHFLTLVSTEITAANHYPSASLFFCMHQRYMKVELNLGSKQPLMVPSTPLGSDVSMDTKFSASLYLCCASKPS